MCPIANKDSHYFLDLLLYEVLYVLSFACMVIINLNFGYGYLLMCIHDSSIEPSQ